MSKKDLLDFKLLTDEEIDEFYRPRKTNSYKTLAPLYVYLVLKEHSSPKKHLTQKEILKFLEDRPYELTLERKALGRVIHLLADTPFGVHSVSGVGTWYDPNASEYCFDDEADELLGIGA